GVVLLAEDSDARAVGFAEVSIRQDHVEGTSSVPVPYLEAWYVVPDRRRQGVGRALLKSAEGWALEAGFCELASDAESDNHESIRAHGNLGFRLVGESVHFVKILPGAETAAAPNGPAEPAGNSEVAAGPPSVT